MLRFQKILVPTDFSDASREAFGHARALAQASGGTVLLVHVMEMPHYPTLFEGAALVAPAIDDDLRAQLRQQLDALAQEHFVAHGIPVNAVLREGPPTQELLDCATEQGADLIVVATHGYTGLKHMLLGSTTEQIVRHACCPVLTVRAGQRDTAGESTPEA
ncbi:MAG: universal stress protein [Planctomycetes bacterium]|nr:universal stress protein [Planctomycetota bacterium]